MVPMIHKAESPSAPNHHRRPARHDDEHFMPGYGLASDACGNAMNLVVGMVDQDCSFHHNEALVEETASDSAHVQQSRIKDPIMQHHQVHPHQPPSRPAEKPTKLHHEDIVRELVHDVFKDSVVADWLLAKRTKPPTQVSQNQLESSFGGYYLTSREAVHVAHSFLKSSILNTTNNWEALNLSSILEVETTHGGTSAEEQGTRPASINTTVWINHHSTSNRCLLTLSDNTELVFFADIDKPVDDVRRAVVEWNERGEMRLTIHFWCESGRSILSAHHFKNVAGNESRHTGVFVLYDIYPESRYASESDIIRTVVTTEKFDCQFCLLRGQACQCNRDQRLRLIPAQTQVLHAEGSWKRFVNLVAKYNDVLREETMEVAHPRDGILFSSNFFTVSVNKLSHKDWNMDSRVRYLRAVLGMDDPQQELLLSWSKSPIGGRPRNPNDTDEEQRTPKKIAAHQIRENRSTGRTAFDTEQYNLQALQSSSEGNGASLYMLPVLRETATMQRRTSVDPQAGRTGCDQAASLIAKNSSVSFPGREEAVIRSPGPAPLSPPGFVTLGSSSATTHTVSLFPRQVGGLNVASREDVAWKADQINIIRSQSHSNPLGTLQPPSVNSLRREGSEADGVVPVHVTQGPTGSVDANAALMLSGAKASKPSSETDHRSVSPLAKRDDIAEAGPSSTPSAPGNKPFHCAQCGSAFLRKHDLLRHVRLKHEGERKYECKLCSKRFLLRWHLETHITTIHDKEKRFVCTVCGAAFGTDSNRKKHERSIHKIS